MIDAETTVHTMVDAAAGHGAEVLTDWPVRRVEATGTGYRVQSDDAQIDAERIVVAAGGWLPTLLEQLPLDPNFRDALPRFVVSQENVYHFPYRDSAEGWPTFIHSDDAIYTYSLPGGRDAAFHGQKLAEYNGGRKINTAARSD